MPSKKISQLLLALFLALTFGAPNSATAASLTYSKPPSIKTVSPVVGELVLGDTGVWQGSPLLSFKWYACGSPSAASNKLNASCKATSETGLWFWPSKSLAGKFLVLAVKATKGGKSLTAFSKSSVRSTINPQTDGPTYMPKISTSALGSADCAVIDSEIYCWGGSSLVLPNYFANETGEAIPGTSGAVGVSVGVDSACALMAGGSINCWGSQAFGKLGDGVYQTGFSPDGAVPVNGLPTKAVAVAAGNSFACALLVDKTVWCWGSFTPEGHGSLQPMKIQGISKVMQISAGVGQACATDISGVAYCWDMSVQLLSNNPGWGIPSPVDNVGSAIQISQGASFACMKTLSTKVFCAGDNEYGQLGNGSRSRSKAAVQVSGLGYVKVVSAGKTHACALANGSILCWGDNTAGQLGINVLGGTKTTPLDPVRNINNAVDVASGALHSCALLETQNVVCWGGNLARGMFSWTLAPRDVPINR